MNNIAKITRTDALRIMEMREAQGIRNTFSIQFYKKNGELVFFPTACSAGLRFNMHENRMRGVQQLDRNGKKIGHVTPVCIDNIRMFNHQQVVL